MLNDGVDKDDPLEGDEMINIMKQAESSAEETTLKAAKEILLAGDAFSERVDEVIFGLVFSPPHRFTVSLSPHLPVPSAAMRDLRFVCDEAQAGPQPQPQAAHGL